MAIGNNATSALGNDIAIGTHAATGTLYADEGNIAIGTLSQSTGTGIAMGSSASASGQSAIAIGSSGSALVSGVAIGKASTAYTEAVAIGLNSFADNVYSVAIGSGASSTGYTSIAMGWQSSAAGSYSIAQGYGSSTTAMFTLALGPFSSATAENAVALGMGSIADVANTVSIGSPGYERRIVNVADAVDATDAVTLGQMTSALAAVSTSGTPYLSVNSSAGPAQALGTDSVALGTGATTADGATYALAIGRRSNAGFDQSMAIGASAEVTGLRGTAIGFRASAARDAIAFGQDSVAASNALAFGSRANSAAASGTAIGNDAVVAAGATAGKALGTQAQANHLRSTALGFGAQTTANNQVMLGGSGSSVVVADIAASDAAQVGEEQVVTVDASGTLGVSNVATVASVNTVRVSMDYLAAVTDAQFSALSGRVDTLESGLNTLSRGLADTNFRLDELDRRMSGGIAAATALGSAIAMPGKTFTIGGNVATYNGEQGYAATITGRVSDTFAVGAGIAGNTGDGEVVAQAGFALGF